MENNYILRNLRYIFELGDDKMISLFALAGKTVSREEVSNWLKKEDDPDFKSIYDKELAYFLTGLIIKNRGKQEGKTPLVEKKLSNNDVLRKLRIALSLQDEDMLEILSRAGQHLSKHELSAFFRKPTQSQYRPCKDQVLRNFIKGLKLTYRREDSSKPESLEG
ncbi:hypothetical protein ADIS_1703 [Lunatimonas lonarensis]|uniref:Uncharacterized protein n=1 Tax=Lunatimonas lonarensis TaxID=1232681 RepID=R7ZUX4_9BACT|nr:DUF1456 family protein [Lunatimonas lonarensis]EON77784.1 hypothetical protein ADIS_1703 [Lunatimonas lonarensis]